MNREPWLHWVAVNAGLPPIDKRVIVVTHKRVYDIAYRSVQTTHMTEHEYDWVISVVRDPTYSQTTYILAHEVVAWAEIPEYVEYDPKDYPREE